MTNSYEGVSIMDESSITEDTYSDTFHPKNAGFSMTYEFNASGNLVCQLILQCRNHPNEEFRNVNNATFPSSPNGISGMDEYSVSECYHAEYRVFCDFTSGDGELTMYAHFSRG